MTNTESAAREGRGARKIGIRIVAPVVVCAAIVGAMLATGCARSSAPGSDGAIIVGGSVTPQTIVIRDGRKRSRA